MNFIYQKIKKEDKEQLFKLIEVVLEGLENKEYFIPHEEWEMKSMFDEKIMRRCMELMMMINLSEWHNYMFHKICLQILKRNLGW